MIVCFLEFKWPKLKKTKLRIGKTKGSTNFFSLFPKSCSKSQKKLTLRKSLTFSAETLPPLSRLKTVYSTSRPTSNLSGLLSTLLKLKTTTNKLYLLINEV